MFELFKPPEGFSLLLNKTNQFPGAKFFFVLLDFEVTFIDLGGTKINQLVRVHVQLPAIKSIIWKKFI